MQSSSFQLTRWSLIRGAVASDPAVRHAALERLCAQYWYPLYAYLRRKGRSPDVAADSVQGLFAHLLDGERLASVREGPGRFRNWLLTALQNYERDQRDRDRAEKRGGGRVPIPIDSGEGERRWELQGAADADPEIAFERAWALETLSMGRTLLEQELHEVGKGKLFESLVGCLLGGDETRPRSELAAELGMSSVTLRVTLHRLRARYRELLVSLVADSLGERAGAGEELDALARALSAEITNSGKNS